MGTVLPMELRLILDAFQSEATEGVLTKVGFERAVEHVLPEKFGSKEEGFAMLGNIFDAFDADKYVWGESANKVMGVYVFMCLCVYVFMC
jgi:hypothetical protein